MQNEISKQIKKPRLLELALHLPVFFGLVLGLWFFLTLNRPQTAITILLVSISSIILRGVLVRKNRVPKATKLIAGIIIALSSFFWLLLLLVSYYLSPIQTVILVLTTIVFQALAEKRLIGFPGELILLPMFFLISLTQWHPASLVLLLLTIFFFLLYFLKIEWLPNGIRWNLILMIAMESAILVPFFWGTSWSDQLPADQARIVYRTHETSTKLFPTLGEDIRFARYDCYGRFLIGTKTGPSGLIRIEDNRIDSSSVMQAGDSINVDCGRRRVTVGDCQTGLIHLLDHDSLADVRQLSGASLSRFDQIQLESNNGFLFFSAENDRQLYIYDITMNDGESWNMPGFINHFTIVPEHDLIIVSTWGGWLHYYRFSDHKPLGKQWLADYALYLHPDIHNNKLWVAGVFSGYLYELSLPTLKMIRKKRIGVGIRHCLPIPDQKKLIIGNVYSGSITILDDGTLKKLSTLQADKYLRDISLSVDKRKVLAAGSFGVLEFSLPD